MTTSKIMGFHYICIAFKCLSTSSFLSCIIFWIYLLSEFVFVFIIIQTVYDVTRRDTFTNLSDVWAKEVELYSTNEDCVKMLVGNKVDRVSPLQD